MLDEIFERWRALGRFRADVSAELGHNVEIEDVRPLFERGYSVDMAAWVIGISTRAYGREPKESTHA